MLWSIFCIKFCQFGNRIMLCFVNVIRSLFSSILANTMLGSIIWTKKQ
jgi:hypothetical protein